MKRVFNWTFGAFFRTIGRTLAFILFGFLLAYLIGKFNLKIPFFTVKAMEMPNYYVTASDLRRNYSTCNLSGDGTIINLPDSNYLKKYYFIYKDLYHDSFNDNNFFIFTDDNPFYIVVHEYINNHWYVNAYKQKNEITQSQYNNYKEDPIFKYRVYFDRNNNKYYLFSVYLLNQYKITSSWSLQNTDQYLDYVYSQNINEYYFYYVSDMYQNNNVCFSNLNKLVTHNVTFHLNGGTAIYNNGVGEYGPVPPITEDFTESFAGIGELNNYLEKLSLKNDIAVFSEWYLNQELTIPYDPTTPLTEDINLYASYEYMSVDSIIANIDFNEYTFPSDQEYAVISIKENFNQGLYIGLGFNFRYLSSYTYIIEDQTFVQGEYIRLGSIGSKNNYYYYHLGHYSDDISFTDSTQVIVIDKADLIKLGVDNVVEHYYTFLLSSNCYVYFTNDLTQVSYYIPSGGGTSQKLENQNISGVVDYTKEMQLDSNSDLITIFNNSLEDRNMHIFDNFLQLWYKFRSIKLTNYFFILITGAIIIALIRGGSRH